MRRRVSFWIEIAPAARREIRSLPGHVRAQAIRLIDDLAQNPRPARAKELRERKNIYHKPLSARHVSKILWLLLKMMAEHPTRMRPVLPM